MRARNSARRYPLDGDHADHGPMDAQSAVSNMRSSLETPCGVAAQLATYPLRSGEPIFHQDLHIFCGGMAASANCNAGGEGRCEMARRLHRREPGYARANSFFHGMPKTSSAGAKASTSIGSSASTACLLDPSAGRNLPIRYRPKAVRQTLPAPNMGIKLKGLLRAVAPDRYGAARLRH
jgi:hypothetical protein